ERADRGERRGSKARSPHVDGLQPMLVVPRVGGERNGAGGLAGPVSRQAACTSGRARMKLGYDRSLYLVAFDHRGSFAKGLFGATGPLSLQTEARVTDAKDLIFEAFQRASASGAPRHLSGVLVDER